MIRVITTMLIFAASINAFSQEYTPSSKSMQQNFPNNSWDGSHKFYNVYCLDFPNSKEATGFDQRFYNNNGIHLSQALYPNYLSIYVAASTIPKGRDVKTEVARLHEIEKYGEKAYQHEYNISLSEGAFSEVISLRIKDVAPKGKNGPFPLVRPILNPTEKPIQSLSVHRIFARGPDRFEIAIIQAAPKGADKSTEQVMTESLESLMSTTLESFENCTSKLPFRQS